MDARSTPRTLQIERVLGQEGGGGGNGCFSNSAVQFAFLRLACASALVRVRTRSAGGAAVEPSGETARNGAFCEEATRPHAALARRDDLVGSLFSRLVGVSRGPLQRDAYGELLVGPFALVRKQSCPRISRMGGRRA